MYSIAVYTRCVSMTALGCHGNRMYNGSTLLHSSKAITCVYLCKSMCVVVCALHCLCECLMLTLWPSASLSMCACLCVCLCVHMSVQVERMEEYSQAVKYSTG